MVGLVGQAGLVCMVGLVCTVVCFSLKCDVFRCIFNQILGSRVICLTKFRSRGLLFGEKGSKGDFRGLGGPNMTTMTCSWAPWGSILGGIFDQKSM